MKIYLQINKQLAILLVCFTLFSVDLLHSQCNPQTVTLVPDANGWSASATTFVSFDSNCSCSSDATNCQTLQIEIPSNFNCSGTILNTQVSTWYNDLIDCYYLPACTYDGLDDWSDQKSNYTLAFGQGQVGGTVDILVCAGEDLPNNQLGVEVFLNTSDLCFVVDCSSDFNPPVCTQDVVTIEGNSQSGIGIIDFNEFIEDECELTFSGVDITNGLDVSNNLQYVCGSTTLFQINAADEAGNSTQCRIEVTVNCASGSDCNVVMDFDGENDYIELPSPYMGDQGFTIEMWVLSQSTSSGTCDNNNTSDLDWILAFDDNNLGMVDCGGDFRVIFRPLCPFGNGLCSGLPTEPLNDGSWHHIAISESATTGFQVYYDGVRFTNFDRAVYDLGGRIRLGNRFGNAGGNLFKGRIDNVRMWDYVRTADEIFENYLCHRPIDPAGMVVFYDFQEGEGDGNNLGILAVTDLAGADQPGTLTNFNLNGTSSNYACDELELDTCTNVDAPEACVEDQCPTDFVDLSTGYDNDNNPLTIGEYTGNWALIDGPNEEVSYPRPAFVLQPHGAWHDLTGAQYISPFPNAANNQSFQDPYVFERCFCVCSPDSKVEINLSMLVDNFGSVDLYDESGTLIQNLLPFNTSNGGEFRLPAFMSQTTHDLQPGKYCLRANLRNDGSTAMGLSLNCVVEGAGFVQSNCCSPNIFITGSVFIDEDCDSNYNFTVDNSLAGVDVVLYDTNGNIVQTVSTDQFGYYVFTNIPEGSYIVDQTAQADFTPTLGQGGYQIDILNGQALGGYDFGNCKEVCCTTDVELEATACQAINSMSIQSEESVVTIMEPRLAVCQRISTIFWGDGTSDIVGPNDPIPSHEYLANGTYVITVEVVSELSNGQTCHTQEINLVYTTVNCEVGDVDLIEEQLRIKTVPVPFNEFFEILISENPNGYKAEVINAIGTRIMDFDIAQGESTFKVNTNDLLPGVYILVLEDNQNSSMLSTRILKAK